MWAGAGGDTVFLFFLSLFHLVLSPLLLLLLLLFNSILRAKFMKRAIMIATVNIE